MDKKNWFVSSVGWTGKMAVRLVVILIASFLLHSCIVSQNMAEPFDGERMPQSNPILDPLTEKGEEFGVWLDETFG